MSGEQVVYQRAELPRVFRQLIWPRRSTSHGTVWVGLVLNAASAVLAFLLTLHDRGWIAYAVLGLTALGAALSGGLLIWMKSHPREL
jgi:hypothetical protein